MYKAIRLALLTPGCGAAHAPATAWAQGLPTSQKPAKKPS